MHNFGKRAIFSIRLFKGCINEMDMVWHNTKSFQVIYFAIAIVQALGNKICNLRVGKIFFTVIKRVERFIPFTKVAAFHIELFLSFHFIGKLIDFLFCLLFFC